MVGTHIDYLRPVPYFELFARSGKLKEHVDCIAVLSVDLIEVHRVAVIECPDILGKLDWIIDGSQAETGLHLSWILVVVGVDVAWLERHETCWRVAEFGCQCKRKGIIDD